MHPTSVVDPSQHGAEDKWSTSVTMGAIRSICRTAQPPAMGITVTIISSQPVMLMITP
jgi:hypothetical protein